MAERPVQAPEAQTIEEVELSRTAQIRALVERATADIQHANPDLQGVPILSYLKQYAAWIEKAHQHFQQASVEELTLSYASEWLLDNYYIVRQAIRQIEEDLPAGYLRQLPKLPSQPFRGFPRIYVAVRAFLSANQLQVDMGDLADYLNALQEQTPLTMGELWAVPIFIRFTMIEALAHALVRIIRSEDTAPLPTPPVDLLVNSDEVVASAITSLRTIANQDWKEFFEDVSLVDRTLRLDPLRVYDQMDFTSRDMYRKVVEDISVQSGVPENEVATAALSLARQAASGKPGLIETRSLEQDNRGLHVGFYFLGTGRQALEEELQYKPIFLERLKRWILRHPTPIYLSGIFLVAGLFLMALGLYAASQAAPAWQILLSLLLAVIPALTVGTGVTNWLVTAAVPPAILPKLELLEPLPPDLHTLVAVPCMLSSPEEVDSIVHQLELHYLRNPSPGLHFAILSDLPDADEESLPADESLVDLAVQRIDELNRQYRRPDGAQPFLLLHRKRVWNASEGMWMGWERKRGKLAELNKLLSGEDHLTFSHLAGEVDALLTVRYVITLDADTILPRDAANCLIGTLAHPLNRAIFLPGSREILSGYTILQPRVEINAQSATRSWFTRIFSGDVGLDLYSLAVSDVYQDFFGEGIFVGKGIYDVEAFRRSTKGAIRENSLLSHDLFEGLLGRAGLVTDITLVEDYPPTYFDYAHRMHRWIRGDWQLLPWLVAPANQNLRLPLIDRWKIFDNLRRSILPPSLILLLIAGWTVLPGAPILWTLTALLSLAVPLLTNLVMGVVNLFSGSGTHALSRTVGSDALRWLLAFIFLPYEALLSIDAILVTLFRLLISRRRLLEWTSAAHTALQLSRSSPETTAWRELGSASIFAVIATVFVVFEKPASTFLALPFLISWVLSPQVALWLNQPIRRKVETLNEEEIFRLRMVARRTWGFFERFVGPEDHWLPPDHFQEAPVGMVAHRTSPTNIGLLLTSTIGAYELGYIDQFSLAARISSTFETLEKLERYRGHFINWLDTRTLQPLNPRYVSTVDSGNLAACLIVTAQSLLALRQAHVFRWQRWEGILDTLALLGAPIDTIKSNRESGDIPPQLSQLLRDAHNRIRSVHYRSDLWYVLFLEISGPVWGEMMSLIAKLVESGEESMNADLLRRIHQVAQQVEHHLAGIRRTIHELVPWIPLLEDPPALFKRPEFQEELGSLRSLLPYSPVFGEIQGHSQEGVLAVERIKAKVQSFVSSDGEADRAIAWLDDLLIGLHRASDNATALLKEYQQVIDRAYLYVDEMDFRFLYDPNRRIFHIGYNMDAAQLDNNYYDLLASEARLTSLIAIAKGDVPQEHWLYMNRPVTRVETLRVLLSWSATMFEYLMPPLFVRSYEGTLLEQSSRGAVIRQIEYGGEKGIPWGISESGFYRFDANQNYQYRAFGVPGLGFKRGLADDLVIAPYASLMAVGYQPASVLQNVEKLSRYGMLGLYGFYEAIDFTENRMMVGQEYGIVRSYMSHHQGMSLLALLNYLKRNIFVERMHADPRIKSMELLLQEQIPHSAPVQNPESEDVKGTQRLVPEPVEIHPWQVPVQTSSPQIQLLSNGSFNSLVCNSGSGYLQWEDIDLTRWVADAVQDNKGTWIYLQELNTPPGVNRLASIGNQPIPGSPDDIVVTYHSHMVVYRRVENDLAATMEVTVPSDDPVEIRRVHISNPTDEPRHLRLTSYGEVILTQQVNDARHPAFNKLFIQSEYLPELNLLIFRRRPRSKQEQPVFLGHMLVVTDNQQVTGAYETDRYRFLGRGQDVRQPEALTSPEYLSRSVGATLDPIFALGQDIVLPPHENVRLAWLTFAAASREGIVELAARYQAWPVIERAFHLSHIAAETRLRKQDIDGKKLNGILQLLSGLIYPIGPLRSDPAIIAANRLGQSGLWPFGISGDYPIFLVKLLNPQRLDLVLEALQAHHYWRERGVKIDLVILNEQQTNYGAELNRLLYRLIARTNSDNWLNQRGGIFVLYSDQMNPEERTLLQAAARVILDGEKGSLDDQLPGYSIPVPHLPVFTPSRLLAEEAEPTPPLPDLEPLQFLNEYGGFSPDGREYVVDLPPGVTTPLPWSNVIGYPEFGFLVTESGSSTTWAANSGENRLTPWSNDPVSDPTGEALYLRDEETGEFWTPTPLPAGSGQAYRVRHGAGYTRFEHNSHGLRQDLRLYADPEDPVKLIRLRLENTWDRPRRITATQYVEWVLGTLRTATQQYTIPEYLVEQEALIASNPYNTEFSQRVAFLAASKKIHGMTADRMEFIGRNGSLRSPASLNRIGLEERVIPGDQPCAVLQVHIDLPPGGAEEFYFVVGQGNDRAHTLALIDKYHEPDQAVQSWGRVHDHWDRLLGAVQVKTPDPAVDLLLNRWMLYQTLSCRIWGRTAFYQSSGAFGFRDQLQDVLAVLPSRAEIARGQILTAARHQFEEGDVLHWWHPPSGRGVRTRFSDDLLWLPYVAAEYVRFTGDLSILSEQIPFRSGSILRPDEDERYGEFPLTRSADSLFEHCRRAIEKGSTHGPHGLPLMGTGDWNDGMNRVGEEGRGESVWLAWFLIETLERFARLCEVAGRTDHSGMYRQRADGYRRAVERAAWDGIWYLRAYYDNGAPLGSSRNKECQIDSIAQSWSVMSGAGAPDHARQAMDSVLQRLVRPEDRLILLFAPPFNNTPLDPGYIKGYVPGIRENGGQYTHAATWVAWAFAQMGQGDKAGDLYRLLNPIYQADSGEKADVYMVEPYVVAADIYSVPPHVRRGGWTWYTGSSGWMYRLGLEAILGLRVENGQLHLDPHIPRDWDGFEICYRHQSSTYSIRVTNPDHVESGIARVTLDGQAVPSGSMPLSDSGNNHQVEVLLGEPSSSS